MKINKYINLFRKDEDGAVVVIIALFMTVIIGLSALALDLGLKYNVESNMQKGLDSVALAAVRELPANDVSSEQWKNAKKVAVKYANMNGIEALDESDVAPIYEDGKIIGVTVKESAEVSYNFANIFGVDTGNVEKKATAKLLKVSGVKGLLPLALPKAVMDKIISEDLFGQNITLKLGPKKVAGIDEDDMRDDFAADFELSGNNGWRGAINFLDNTTLKTIVGGDYKDAMENGGFDHLVNIGDPVETNSGNMPVDVEGKIVVGQNATVPVVNRGSDGVLRIVGFVTFKITNLEGNSANSKKVSILTSSYVSDYIAPGDTETGVVLNDYGVRAAKLVDY